MKSMTIQMIICDAKQHENSHLVVNDRNQGQQISFPIYDLGRLPYQNQNADEQWNSEQISYFISNEEWFNFCVSSVDFSITTTEASLTGCSIPTLINMQ